MYKFIQHTKSTLNTLTSTHSHYPEQEFSYISHNTLLQENKKSQTLVQKFKIFLTSDNKYHGLRVHYIVTKTHT